MSGTQLALNEQKTAMTPMDLITLAAQRGASVEQMQQLFELKLRVEADEARKAYDEAMSQFKVELPRITKNITVTDGPLKGKMYADLYAVVSSITPSLSAFGLSASWKLTRDEPAWIEVSCSIRHKQGHAEVVSMGGPPDSGGAKNAIQARASTVSYLERYTLLAAIGSAAAGIDTDANPPTTKKGMDEPLAQEWLDAINQAPNLAALKDVFAKAYRAAEALNDQPTMKSFTDAKNRTKETLK